MPNWRNVCAHATKGGTQRHRNEALLQRFRAKPAVAVLLPSRETAEHYARIFMQLRRAETPVPDNDFWIAALALEHDLTLITRDRILKGSRNSPASPSR